MKKTLEVKTGTDKYEIFIGDKILELETSQMANDIDFFIRDFDYNSRVFWGDLA